MYRETKQFAVDSKVSKSLAESETGFSTLAIEGSTAWLDFP